MRGWYRLRGFRCIDACTRCRSCQCLWRNRGHQWSGGCNRGRELTSLFLECVVALRLSAEAREILGKANLRLLELAPQAIDASGPHHVRSILGGLLVQDLDDQAMTPDDWTVASQRPPTAQEQSDLEFAWRLVRHVRSNAIVVAREGKAWVSVLAR